MVTTCNQCGGLRGDPGEMFGGVVCACPAPAFTCSWKERSEEQQRYGFLIGVLLGLRWRVSLETRKVIEDSLIKVGYTDMDNPLRTTITSP